MMRTRKLFSPIFVALAVALSAFVVFGCGGGGGGGGGTNSTSTSTTSTTSSTAGVADVSLVAYYNGTQSPVSTAIGGSASSLAVQVGDSIQFSYVGVNTSTQDPVTVTGNNVSSNAPSSVATLSGNILTVVGASGSTSYTVTGSYQGKSFSFSFTSVAVEAKVTGLVEDNSSSVFEDLPVIFYNSTGAVVAQTVTGVNGVFVAGVPTTAVSFTIDLSKFKGETNEYSYNASNYLAEEATCYSPAPKLTAGHTTSLLSNVVVFASDPNNPPPAPTGCGQ